MQNHEIESPNITIDRLVRQLTEERRKAKTAENFIKRLKVQIENTIQSRVQLIMIKQHLEHNKQDKL